MPSSHHIIYTWCMGKVFVVGYMLASGALLSCQNTNGCNASQMDMVSRVSGRGPFPFVISVIISETAAHSIPKQYICLDLQLTLYTVNHSIPFSKF